MGMILQLIPINSFNFVWDARNYIGAVVNAKISPNHDGTLG